MLLIFLLLTGRGVLGRGLSVEPASFTTHGYTSQVKLTTLNIVNNYFELEATANNPSITAAALSDPVPKLCCGEPPRWQHQLSL